MDRPAGFVMRPLSGSSSPAIIFRSVVFPAPFGPARPTRSPSSICQLTASRSTRPPNDLESEESWITGVGPLGLEPKETGKRAILAHARGLLFFAAVSFAAAPVVLVYAMAAHVRKSSIAARPSRHWPDRRPHIGWGPPMRVARILTVLLGLSLSMARADVCVAAESANGSVVVTAQFASRTSLKVSTELLQFAVTDVRSVVGGDRRVLRRGADAPERRSRADGRTGRGGERSGRRGRCRDIADGVGSRRRRRRASSIRRRRSSPDDGSAADGVRASWLSPCARLSPARTRCRCVSFSPHRDRAAGQGVGGSLITHNFSPRSFCSVAAAPDAACRVR